MLQNMNNDAARWTSPIALEAVRGARVELQEVLWMAAHLLEETDEDDIHLFAPTIWEEMRSSMEHTLTTFGEQMERARRIAFPQDPDDPQPTSQGREVYCLICTVRLPSVAFNCGHVLCALCAARVFVCPVCRTRIFTRHNIFL